MKNPNVPTLCSGRLLFSFKQRFGLLELGVYLGENEIVRQAVGRHPLIGRGVRVLSMDGGGMKVILFLHLTLLIALLIISRVWLQTLEIFICDGKFLRSSINCILSIIFKSS